MWQIRLYTTIQPFGIDLLHSLEAFHGCVCSWLFDQQRFSRLLCKLFKLGEIDTVLGSVYINHIQAEAGKVGVLQGQKSQCHTVMFVCEKFQSHWQLESGRALLCQFTELSWPGHDQLSFP